jgi:hypothetical protein
MGPGIFSRRKRMANRFLPQLRGFPERNVDLPMLTTVIKQDQRTVFGYPGLQFLEEKFVLHADMRPEKLGGHGAHLDQRVRLGIGIGVPLDQSKKTPENAMFHLQNFKDVHLHSPQMSTIRNYNAQKSRNKAPASRIVPVSTGG